MDEGMRTRKKKGHEVDDGRKVKNKGMDINEERKEGTV